MIFRRDFRGRRSGKDWGIIGRECRDIFTLAGETPLEVEHDGFLMQVPSFLQEASVAPQIRPLGTAAYGSFRQGEGMANSTLYLFDKQPKPLLRGSIVDVLEKPKFENAMSKHFIAHPHRASRIGHRASRTSRRPRSWFRPHFHPNSPVRPRPLSARPTCR